MQASCASGDDCAQMRAFGLWLQSSPKCMRGYMQILENVATDPVAQWLRRWFDLNIAAASAARFLQKLLVEFSTESCSCGHQLTKNMAFARTQEAARATISRRPTVQCQSPHDRSRRTRHRKNSRKGASRRHKDHSIQAQRGL